MTHIKTVSVFSVAVTVVFTVLLLAAPSVTMSAASGALLLCGTNIIPALFPFLVCADLFLSLNVTAVFGNLLRPLMQPLFRVRAESAVAFVMGIISGYPVGAKVTADLVCRGELPRAQGERLLAFCNNSGPLFLLGAVGSGMLGNPKLGILLYVAHFLSSLTVGIALRCFGKRESSRPAAPPALSASKPFGTLLGDAVSHAADSIFTICGFVLLFQILLALAEHLGIVTLTEHLFLRAHLPHTAARPLLYALLEPTGACRACADIYADSPLLCLMLISAAVGWSGLSVHLQVAAVVRHAELRLHYYWLGKTLQAVLAPFYTFLLLIWRGDTVSVFAPHALPASVPISLPHLCTLSVFYFFLGTVLLLAFIGAARLLHRVCHR